MDECATKLPNLDVKQASPRYKGQTPTRLGLTPQNRTHHCNKANILEQVLAYLNSIKTLYNRGSQIMSESKYVLTKIFTKGDFCNQIVKKLQNLATQGFSGCLANKKGTSVYLDIDKYLDCVSLHNILS